jgi:hypothetical protein
MNEQEHGTTPIYKITFVKNSIASCRLADDAEIKGDVEVERYKDLLIHAMIKAADEAEAKAKAEELIKENSTG